MVSVANVSGASPPAVGYPDRVTELWWEAVDRGQERLVGFGFDDLVREKA